MTSFIVQKFDINNITTNVNILIKGSRCTGKTILANYLLAQLNAEPIFYLDYKNQYNFDYLKYVICNKNVTNKTRFIVIDDYLALFTSDDELYELFTLGFEYNVSYIICTQYLDRKTFDFMMDHIDFLFILQASELDKRYLAEKFNLDTAAIFPKLSDFRALVIDNRTFGEINKLTYYQADVETYDIVSDYDSISDTASSESNYSETIDDTVATSNNSFINVLFGSFYNCLGFY